MHVHKKDLVIVYVGQYLPHNIHKIRDFAMQVLTAFLSKSKGQYHEKNHSSTFNLSQRLLEGKTSRRFWFLDIFSCSRDIHLLKRVN